MRERRAQEPGLHGPARETIPPETTPPPAPARPAARAPPSPSRQRAFPPPRCPAHPPPQELGGRARRGPASGRPRRPVRGMCRRAAPCCTCARRRAQTCAGQSAGPARPGPRQAQVGGMGRMGLSLRGASWLGMRRGETRRAGAGGPRESASGFPDGPRAHSQRTDRDTAPPHRAPPGPPCRARGAAGRRARARTGPAGHGDGGRAGRRGGAAGARSDRPRPPAAAWPRTRARAGPARASPPPRSCTSSGSPPSAWGG